MGKGGKNIEETVATPAGGENAEVEAGGLVPRLGALCRRAEEALSRTLASTPEYIRRGLIVLSLVATAGILFTHLLRGLPDAHDLPDHVAMATQFREGLSEGHLYPRWNGSFNFGLGEPTGVFYPPGLPGLVGLVSLVSRIEVLTALYIVLFALTVIGMWGMYTLTRRVAGRGTGILACAVFGLAPFRAFELHAAGLLSAYSAGCFVPWLLGALVDTSTRAASSRGRTVTALRIGFAYGAIALFNLPCAVLTAYLVCFWALVETVMVWSFRPLLTTALGGVLGFLLASVYLLPAIVEMQDIVVPHSVGEPLFRSNFVFQFEGSWMGPGLWSVFARMASFQAALLVIAVVAVCWRLYALYLEDREVPRVASVWLRMLIVFGSTSLFLATPLSSWFWERLPVLQRVDLPWRLLDGLAVPAAAVFAAVIGAFLAGSRQRRWVRLAATGGILIITFSLLYNFQVAIASMNDRLPDSRAENLEQAFYRRPGYFLPRGASDPRLLRDRPLVEVLSPDSRVEILEWTGSRRRLRVSSDVLARFLLRTYHFPGWTAEVTTGPEPRDARVAKDPASGLLSVETPPGEREVVVSFGLTLIRMLAMAASALTILAVASILWRLRRRECEEGEPGEGEEDAGAAEQEALTGAEELLETV